MKPVVALPGLLMLAGCVVPPQQPSYVTRPFVYAPPTRPAVPAQPYQPAPALFQPPTPLVTPDPVPQSDATPDPVAASVPQPAPPATEVPQAAAPIQKTTTPDSNSNVPMMGFRPMRGQKPPGA